jgi:TonB family protein
MRRVLAAEADRSVAAEMLRALVLLGGRDAESDLLPVAQKHDLVGALTAAAAGARMDPPDTAAPKEDASYTRVLVSSALPPGMLRDVMTITRCKPKAGLDAIGIVDYRRDGRPRHVSMAKQEIARGCQEAAVAALALSLAPFGLATSDLPARKTVVFVPMDEGALECADLPEPTKIERLPEPGVKPDIREPKKVRNVNPYYPPAARASGRQGVVVLEGVIGETGCMRSVTVKHGASPDLEVSALRTVGQWRYTPTLLDGKPVSVIMTITVNYRLN